MLGRGVEINTQQPRGTNCYSHFVQTSRDGPGDGSAEHHLCPAGDSLATAWALLLSVGTGMGTDCICPSPVGVPKEQRSHTCYKVLAQSPLARATRIPKTGGYRGARSGKVRAVSGGESPRLCPYTPSSHSSADQRSVGRVCCYLQCHL